MRKISQIMPKRYYLHNDGRKCCWVDVFMLDEELGPSETAVAQMQAVQPTEPQTIRMWGKECALPRRQIFWNHAYRFLGDDNAASDNEPEVSRRFREWANKSKYFDAARPFVGSMGNYERDENDYHGFHQDKTKDIDMCEDGSTVILGLSMGALRRLDFIPAKGSGKPVLSVPLRSMQAYAMGGLTNLHFKHGVPKEKKPCGMRCSLTLRRFKQAAAAGAEESPRKRAKVE